MLYRLVSAVSTGWIFQAFRGTDAFASYMTTNSGCLIELDPSEIIMNNAVQEAPAWTDTDGSIELSVSFHETFLDGEAIPHEERPDVIPPDRIVLLMEDLPTIVYLKVTGQRPDAQYVMQAASEVDEEGAIPAEFSHGMCDGNARFTGRINDAGAELTIRADRTVVWAGWASGHEAVKLLPGFVFRLKSAWDEEGNIKAGTEDSGKVHGTQRPWTDFMATEIGCTSVQLSETPVEIFGRTVVEPTPHAATLRMGETSDSGTGTLYTIEFTGGVDAAESMVIEVTAGGTLASTLPTARVACGGARVVLSQVPSQNFRVGTMDVPDSVEATALHVRGIYSVKDQPGVLYMTPAFEISHVARNNSRGEESGTERKTRFDAQKVFEEEEEEELSGVDDYAKTNRGTNHDAVMVEKRKYRPDPQKELEKKMPNRKNHGDLHAQVKAHKERTERVRHNHDLDEEEVLAHMREGRVHSDDRPHRSGLIDKTHDKTENKHSRAKHAHHGASHHAGVGIRMTEEEFPKISFDSSYFGAILFFVGSTFATIQICRCASTRGTKGRLDL